MASPFEVCLNDIYIIYSTEKENKKCKGVKKKTVEKTITLDDFEQILIRKVAQPQKMNVIRSNGHEMYTEEVNKVALSADDDERIILDDGVHTLAHGHYKLTQQHAS